MIGKKIKEKIQTSFKRVYDKSIATHELNLEIPADESHGDFSSNVSFKMAGKLKKNPKKIAAEISEDLSCDLFECESKGGFLNFRLTESALLNELKELLKFNVEKRDKTMVLDYSAPNIAKAFGIGHLRSTIVGQAIYNIYNFCGWETIGVNHLGDWGTQYGKLLYQIVKNNLKPEDLSVDDLERLYVEFHEEAEEDPGMEDEARRWFKRLENGDKKARKIWKKCVETSLEEFNRTYSLLNVDIDHVMGESFYQDKMEAVIKEAKKKEIAKKSEGALIVDFKDEMPPAMLLKSDGSTTYFTRDLATAKYRIDRWDPDLLVYEIGADQKLHMRQLFKTVEMLGWKDESSFMHVAHGMYRLKDGAMSTRKGKTIHLEDVLNEAVSRAEDIIDNSKTTGEITEEEKKEIAKKIGVGAVKYADLKKHYKKDIAFDWDKVLNLKGNSGPYLQYTTLRAESVLKDAAGFDFEFIDLSEKERSLVKKITEFEERIDAAKRNFTPSTIANYAYEVARTFNSFYNDHPILNSKEKRDQRLTITKASFESLKKALELLGISIPEKM